MKFKLYILYFLLLLFSCKTSLEKTLGTYKRNNPSSFNNEIIFLQLNKRQICELTTADSTFHGTWIFKKDTISIFGLSNFDSLVFVRKNAKLLLLNHRSSDSLLYHFKKTNENKTNTRKCKTAECWYHSTIQSADKLYQVARSTNNISDYQHALILYEEAARVKPAESYPKNMINSISDQIEYCKNKGPKDEHCKQMLLYADRFFEKKDYDKAKQLYTEYLNFRCASNYLEHVNHRIILLDSLQK